MFAPQGRLASRPTCADYTCISPLSPPPTGAGPSTPPLHPARIHDRSNDFVVPGAATQISRQPVTRLLFARAAVRVEQRFGCNDQTLRADAALQRRVLEALLLQRIEPLALGDAFDRRDA